MRRRTGLVLFLAALALGAISLSFWLRSLNPPASTPLGALGDFPGNLTSDRVASVEILDQREVVGGRSLLYRWQTFESQATDTYCLGATFLTPEGKLWRAQSSGSVGTRAQPCTVAPDVEFLVSWYPGGNVTPLTTAYGISQHGEQVRVHWSDGQTTVAPLKYGAFLDVRPETLQVRQIEILDAGGAVVRQQDFS